MSTLIDAPAEAVWAAASDIASHVEWMDDAVAIRFVSQSRRGVGTAFDCDTRVGPFALTDRMEVTTWEEGREIGIRHVGIVTGEGRFRIEPDGARTRFVWEERLAFPWWMGGAAGGVVGGRVLDRVWRGNLASLKARLETSGKRHV